ncbi:carbonic anhydrase 2-like [Sabethes cyaneus]|uniref:carbonic anhydrase 2-like n=1 Tax=Sabethes cyaneus TaxID=53552 RepID=UPI00237D38C4|nr:carbonic anhydrase 2-like [Sabethes cyaneus]
MNLNVNPIGVTARNTGRAAHFTLTYPSSRSLLLVGGSLQGTFAFAGIHFHWSSEHTIDQQQFPIEMHLVFFNRMYNSLAEAAFHDNGLAVVGFFFTNNALAKSRRWMDSLKNIRRRRSSYTFVHPESINLARLVGTEIGEHFEYLGSLTIPPCYETVTWIIRKKPLLISNMQLSLFRSLESDEGLMNNNNRPLQNLNNRTVWMSSK